MRKRAKHERDRGLSVRQRAKHERALSTTRETESFKRAKHEGQLIMKESANASMREKAKHEREPSMRESYA